MTRQDFELIAGWMRQLREDGLSLGGIIRTHTLDALVEEMADHLAARNPRFDRQRFIGAIRNV